MYEGTELGGDGADDVVVLERELRQLELHAERAWVVHTAPARRERPGRVERAKLRRQLSADVVVCDGDALKSGKTPLTRRASASAFAPSGPMLLS